MDMSLYDNNIRILKTRHPTLYDALMIRGSQPEGEAHVFSGEKGNINVRFSKAQGKRSVLYQEEDPLREADRLVSGLSPEVFDTVFLVGMGLGYAALAAVKRFDKLPFIVVIEPSWTIFRLALQYVDLRPVFVYKALALYVGPEIDMPAFCRRHKFNIMVGDIKLLAHLPPPVFLGSRYENLKSQISDWVRTTQREWATGIKYGRRILANTLSNLPSLFAGEPLGRVRGMFKGCTAFCVGAGPSLDGALDDLKKIGDKGVIIALDSAVRILLSRGIVPHMVVTADIKATNFEKLRLFVGQLQEAILVFAVEANPMNVACFLGSRRIAICTHNLLVERWLKAHWEFDCRVSEMTSVGQAAIATALSLEFAEIVLVGMDLSIPKGSAHAHARGAVFRSVDNSPDSVQIGSVDGFLVSSQATLVADKNFIENALLRSSTRLYQTSMQGAFIKAQGVKTLAEVVATMDDGPPVDVHAILGRLGRVPWAKPQEVLRECRLLRQNITVLRASCQLNRQHADFEQNQLKAVGRSRKKQVRQILSDYLKFQRQNDNLIQLLEAARLESVKTLSRRRIELERPEDTLTSQEKSNCELTLISDFYASLDDAAAFLEKILAPQFSYFDQIQSLSGKPEKGVDCKAARLSQARLYVTGKQYWQAIRAFRSLLEEDPDNYALWQELADIYFSLELWDLAKTHLSKMRNRFPSRPEVQRHADELDQRAQDLFKQIETVWLRGELEEARRLLMTYACLNPFDQKARKLQNDIRRLDEERDYKQQQINRSSAGNIALTQQMLDKAQQYVLLCEFDAAIGILEGVSRQDSDRSAYYKEMIGDIRLQGEDFKSALWHYSQAMKQGANFIALASKIADMKALLRIFAESKAPYPHQLVQTILLARKTYHRGNLKDAMALFVRMIGEHPARKELYIGLCDILLDAGQFEDVIDIIDKLPQNNKALKEFTVAGRAQCALGVIDAAGKLADQALAMDLRAAPALNLKGMICAAKKDFSGADKWFRKAVRADSGWGEPLTNLGLLAWEKGSTGQALDYFERAFFLSPDISAVYGACHAAVTELEVFDRFRGAFQKAALAFSFHKQLVFLYIDVLLKSGEYENAMLEIQNAMASLGCDDGLISSALAIRQKMGTRAAATPRSRPLMSVCIIVKDQAKTLSKVLLSAKAFGNEIIVVDRGSQDCSREIASIFGTREIKLKANEDQAAAWNKAIAGARGKWVLIITGDEKITHVDEAAFALLQEKPENPGDIAAFEIKCRPLAPVGQENRMGGANSQNSVSFSEDSFPGCLRLFANLEGVFFDAPSGSNKEPQLVLNDAQIKVSSIDITIHKVGAP